MKNVYLAIISGLLISTSPISSSAESPLHMTVYRSPNCSCCGKWVDSMKQNGITVKEIHTDQMIEVKKKFLVPDNLQSCHTALIEGHVVEGHVPVEDVKKMIQSGPASKSISVPGMPVGSPGMEMGGKREAFSVIRFDNNGKSDVLNHYPGN